MSGFLSIHPCGLSTALYYYELSMNVSRARGCIEGSEVHGIQSSAAKRMCQPRKEIETYSFSETHATETEGRHTD
jgi:hypothetical protein